MTTGQPDYTSKADVNITNATLDVDATGSSIDANITNATVTVDGDITGTVEISGTPTVQFAAAQSVNIGTAPTLDVTFSGTQDVNIATGSCDVEIQNASIDVFTTSASIEQHKVSVTAASTTQAWTNAIKSFIFYNDGSGEVHINFDGAATDDHFIIRAKSSFSLDFASQDTRFKCLAGNTATVYALGVY